MILCELKAIKVIECYIAKESRITRTPKMMKVYLSLTCPDKNKLLVLALSNWDREEKSICQIDNLLQLKCHIW